MKKKVIFGLSAAACLMSVVTVNAQTQAQLSWMSKATERDKQRVESWKKSLDDGVEEAIRAGHGSEISGRSPLFSTSIGKRALGLPTGKYHCSTTKLGGAGGSGLAYIAYPKFRCMVTEVGDRLQFTKLTGSQMTSGWIYKTDRATGIYLGTSYYGYEDRAPSYGSDEKRDDVAIVERIGDRRWRMVFPDPYYESVADVMELTPVR